MLEALERVTEIRALGVSGVDLSRFPSGARQDNRTQHRHRLGSDTGSPATRPAHCQLARLRLCLRSCQPGRRVGVVHPVDHPVDHPMPRLRRGIRTRDQAAHSARSGRRCHSAQRRRQSCDRSVLRGSPGPVHHLWTEQPGRFGGRRRDRRSLDATAGGQVSRKPQMGAAPREIIRRFAECWIFQRPPNRRW